MVCLPASALQEAHRCPCPSSSPGAAAAGNDFSLALLREVNARKEGENVFISPFSAAVALGMTLNGADGTTFEGMRTTLGLEGRSPQEINEAYQGLTALLLSLDGSVDLGIANAIFHDDAYPFEPTFLQTNQQYFDAEVRGLDFADMTGVVREVNDWAKSATKGRIEKVLEDPDPDHVMFLLNALYFKGAWRTQFDPARTQSQPFARDGGGEGQVPMMQRAKVPLRHAFVGGTEVAELPYGNGAFAMTIVLPPREQDIDAAVAELTPERWSTLLAALQDRELDVHIPRFRLEYEDTWNDVLTAMGMGEAFTSRANFGRMSSTGALQLSFVKQNTFVEVNEEGTEAAAVTTVGVIETSLPPTFRADRPFLFAIRERLSGTVLFVGKIATL